MIGGFAGGFTDAQIIGLALAGLVVLLALGGLIAIRFRRSPTTEELERRRRIAINARGKLGDGEITDVEGAAIIYEYQVAGVGYAASQDVSTLESLLPEDLMSIVGPASVKFDRRNPANSIVLCEEWSGLRHRV